MFKKPTETVRGIPQTESHAQGERAADRGSQVRPDEVLLLLLAGMATERTSKGLCCCSSRLRTCGPSQALLHAVLQFACCLKESRLLTCIPS